MLTQENLAALKLWRAAEGKAPTKGGRVPTAAERRAAQFKLAESVASGEFPTQILPAARATLQQVYEAQDLKHSQFTRRITVEAIDVEEDFYVYSFGDQSNIPGTNAGDTFVAGGLPRLLPREKYPNIGLTASGKKVKASKIGEAFTLDWEAIVRSRGARVNLIRDAFNAFGRHAANQEEIDVAKLLVKAGGFATAAGEGLNGARAATAGNGFSVANPDLSNPEDIQAAIAFALKGQHTIGSGTTIDTILADYSSYTILTSPENAPRIRQTLNARRINRSRGSAGGAEWEEILDFGADIEVIGWSWLKKVYPGLGKGWVLIPNVGADDLPVLTSNYLEGNEAPSTFIKDSNMRRVGGGGVDSLVDGDYDSDGVETKVRHVHGASALFTNGIVYSTGANA